MRSMMEVTSGIYAQKNQNCVERMGIILTQIFQGLFGKRDSFLLSITRVPEKSSNIPLNIFYMSTEAKCLRIARACNQSFSLNSINPLVMHMFSQGAKEYIE